MYRMFTVRTEVLHVIALNHASMKFEFDLGKKISPRAPPFLVQSSVVSVVYFC
jgi:hypothetical protein